MHDICCIGHITHDHIITPHSDIHLPGGTSYYFSCGIQALNPGRHGISYRLVTSIADTDADVIARLRRTGIETTVIPSRETLYFENIYDNDVNNRRQRVLATADPFSLKDLQDIEARYIVLGSLLAEDFNLEILRYLHSRSILTIDAQGFLRSIRDYRVYATDWEWKMEALKYTDILKINEYEVEVLTGETDYHKACLLLARWGVKEVLLTLGENGSILLHEGTFYELPALHPHELVDTTGCGDTYVMGYIFQRASGADVLRAGQFATAVSCAKLEHHGPFNETYEEATARMLQQQ